MSGKGQLGVQEWTGHFLQTPIRLIVIVGYFALAGCSATTSPTSPALTPPPTDPLGIETQPAIPVDPPFTEESPTAAPVSQNSVRVIVTLAVPFTPEGYLSAADVAAQRSAIAQAQADVLASLAGHNVTVVSQSKYTPTMVLQVDQAGLKILQGSPLVAQIKMDTALPLAKP